MKLTRSQVNRAIEEAMVFFKKQHIYLPPFAYWRFHDWDKFGAEYDEIRKVRLGWDVTDFGLGNMAKYGRVIFTLRNGQADLMEPGRLYAQKVMYLKGGQKSPRHYHKVKMEDIINLGPGEVVVQIWLSDIRGKPAKRKFWVSVDGRKLRVMGGERLKLVPGESIFLPRGTIHSFWADAEKGPTITMEVSSVNDDATDNVWINKAERFPRIIEDEPARFRLCSEY